MEALPIFPTLVRLLYHISDCHVDVPAGELTEHQRLHTLLSSAQKPGDLSGIEFALRPKDVGTRRFQRGPSAAGRTVSDAKRTPSVRRLGDGRIVTQVFDAELSLLPRYMQACSVFAYEVSEIQSIRRLITLSAGRSWITTAPAPSEKHVAQERDLHRQRSIRRFRVDSRSECS